MTGMLKSTSLYGCPVFVVYAVLLAACVYRLRRWTVLACRWMILYEKSFEFHTWLNRFKECPRCACVSCTWRSERSCSSGPPLKCFSESRCCTHFWVSCQIGGCFPNMPDIVESFFMEFFCISGSESDVSGSTLRLLARSRSSDSELLRSSYHLCFYVDLMFVDLWNKHLAGMALAGWLSHHSCHVLPLTNMKCLLKKVLAFVSLFLFIA